MNENLSSEPEQNEKLHHFYQFVQLDPRKSLEENPDYDFGLEITEPKLLKDGVVNLDHHGEGTTADTPSAAEQALACSLLPEDAVGATIRLDKDSLTAMAVMQMRGSDHDSWINKEIVAAVGKLDRLGPKAKDEVNEFYGATVVLDNIVFDKTSLEEKVDKTIEVLMGRFDQEKIAEIVAKRQTELEKARRESEIKEIVPGKLVFVEGKNRFATTIGYEKAPVIVAYNPEMPVLERQTDGSLQSTGETYQKFTVCRYDEHVKVDLPSALKEIQDLEEGWGGRGDIFGSPQNRSSALKPEQIIEIIKKYLG